jgi:putative transposase
MLAKHVADASWAQLAAMLDYKAASAGVEFVRVDPRGTSQECPQCGQVAAKALDERRHRCDCGADIDRTLLRLWSYTFVPSVSGPGRALSR